MTHFLLPLDDHDADREELAFEQALADAEQRGLEILLERERQKELAVAGNCENWP